MKRIALVVLVSFFGLSTYGQGIDLGVKLGANFSNISDAYELEFESKTGFVGGIFLGIKFNEKLAIQSELLYSQQGAKFDAGDIDFSYVSVPVLFKYYLIQGLNIQAGPQFGFVVDEDVPDVIDNIIESNDFTTTGVVGLGYDLPMGLRVSARYNFGLTEVFEGGKNSVVSLAVGFSFL